MQKKWKEEHARLVGFTLQELLIAIALVAIALAIAIPAYQHFVRKARLEEAHAALLDNTRYLERFYFNRRSYKQTSTQWANLPVTQTQHFCIRFQGTARAVEEGKYTLKAIPKDASQKGQVLIITQDHGLRLCEQTTSRCDDGKETFSGRAGVDSQCELWH